MGTNPKISGSDVNSPVMTLYSLQSRFKVRFPNQGDFLACGWKDELETAYFLDGKQTGWGQLKVSRCGNGQIEYARFYPLERLGDSAKRSGIGTLAHVGTLVQAIQKIPDIGCSYTVFHNPPVTSPEYQSFLGHLDLEFSMPIGPYLQRCLAYAASRGFVFPNLFLSQKDSQTIK